MSVLTAEQVANITSAIGPPNVAVASLIPGITHSQFAPSTLTLPPEWKGPSPLISEIMYNLITDSFETVLDGVFPLTPSSEETDVLHYDTVDFGTTRPSPVGSVAPVRTFSVIYTKDTDSFDTNGLGFEVSHKEYMKPAVQNTFQLCMQQLASRLFAKIFTDAIYRAWNFRERVIDYMLRTVSQEKRVDLRTMFLSVLQEEALCWGITDVEDAFRLLAIRSQSLITAKQGTADSLIVTNEVYTRISTVDPIDISFKEAGPAGPARRAGAPSIVNGMANISKIIQLPTYNALANPLTRVVEIGEYYPLEDRYRGNNRVNAQITSGLRDISVENIENQRMDTISFIKLVRNSGRYDRRTGEPKSISDIPGGSSSTTTTGGDDESDMFLWKDDRGELHTTKFFGSLKHLDHRDYSDMAQSLVRAFGSANGERDASASIGKLFTDISTILNALEKVPYSQHFFADLIAENKDSVDGVPDADIDVNSPFNSSYKPNESGSLTLPDITNATNLAEYKIWGSKLPIGYNNYGGLMQIASETRGGTWTTKGYREEFGKLVEEWLTIFQRFASFLISTFPDHPFLNPEHLPENVFLRTPESALFLNLFQSHQRYNLYLLVTKATGIYAGGGEQEKLVSAGYPEGYPATDSTKKPGITDAEYLANLKVVFKGQVAAAKKMAGTIATEANLKRLLDVLEIDGAGADAEQVSYRVVYALWCWMILAGIAKKKDAQQLEARLKAAIEAVLVKMLADKAFDKMPDFTAFSGTIIDQLKNDKDRVTVGDLLVSRQNDANNTLAAALEQIRSYDSDGKGTILTNHPTVAIEDQSKMFAISPLTWYPYLLQDMSKKFKADAVATASAANNAKVVTNFSVMPSSIYTPFAIQTLDELKNLGKGRETAHPGLKAYAPGLIAGRFSPQSVERLDNTRSRVHLIEGTDQINASGYPACAVIEHKASGDYNVVQKPDILRVETQFSSGRGGVASIGAPIQTRKTLKEIMKQNARNKPSMSSVPTVSSVTPESQINEFSRKFTSLLSLTDLELAAESHNSTFRRALYFCDMKINVPWVRSLAPFFVFAKNNLATIEAMHNNEISLPFDGYAIRPWMRYTTDSGILVQSGGGTGKTYVKQTRVERSEDNTHGITTVGAKCTYVTVLTNPKNCVHLPNITVIECLQGANVEFFNPSDIQNNSILSLKQRHSVIGVLCSKGELPSNLKVFDLRGTFLATLGKTTVSIGESFYPQWKFLIKYWGIKNEMFTARYPSGNIYGDDSETNTVKLNSIIWRGPFIPASPEIATGGVAFNRSDSVDGTGHRRGKNLLSRVDRAPALFTAFNS